MTIPWGLKFWKNTGLQNALKENKDIHFEVVIHQEEPIIELGYEKIRILTLELSCHPPGGTCNCLLELGYIRK